MKISPFKRKSKFGYLGNSWLVDNAVKADKYIVTFVWWSQVLNHTNLVLIACNGRSRQVLAFSKSDNLSHFVSALFGEQFPTGESQILTVGNQPWV